MVLNKALFKKFFFFIVPLGLLKPLCKAPSKKEKRQTYENMKSKHREMDRF